jgi:death on curing protein
VDPIFLDLDDVLLIHEEQLARYGGGAGIRDAGLLDSALGTPRATFGGDLVHEDLFAMAAAHAFHLAQNQPFVDGNKRTGLLAALVFLDLNGIVVTDPGGRLYDGGGVR